MDPTRVQLEEWLKRYGEAWERHDPDLAATLYSQDVTYQVTPFQEPQRGLEERRTYTLKAGSLQRDVSFGYDIISVDPAVVHWWTRYVKKVNGEETRLDGIFLLEFDDNGLCRSLREWWHADPSPSF